MDIIKAQKNISRLHDKIEVMKFGLINPWYDIKNKKVYAVDSATKKQLWRGTYNGVTWDWDIVMQNTWMFSGGIFTMSSGSHIARVSDSGYIIKIAPDFSSYVVKTDSIRVPPLNVSLGFAESNGVVMFCEYDTSLNAAYRRIWKSTDQGDTWTVALYDPTIRHWHCLQVDPYTGHWWAMSGDSDPEVKVVKSTDDGVTWTTVASGSQDLRGIGFVFKEKELLWASDANATQSRAMKSDKTTFAPVVIGNIPGTSYGNIKTLDGRMVFNVYVETASLSHDDTFLMVSDGTQIKEILRFNMTPGRLVGGIHVLTDVDNDNRLWATVRDTRLGENVLMSLILPFDPI